MIFLDLLTCRFNYSQNSNSSRSPVITKRKSNQSNWYKWNSNFTCPVLSSSLLVSFTFSKDMTCFFNVSGPTGVSGWKNETSTSQSCDSEKFELIKTYQDVNKDAVAVADQLFQRLTTTICDMHIDIFANRPELYLSGLHIDRMVEHGVDLRMTLELLETFAWEEKRIKN